MLAQAAQADVHWNVAELYPLASGLLLGLSLPPFRLSFLALIALVPLLFYLDQTPTASRVIRGGVITAIVYFGINLCWLLAVGSFSWLIFPGYAAILFIYTCNFFVFVLTVVMARTFLGIDFLYTAPFAWVVSERLRCYGDLSAPWSTFGYALTQVPFFLQFADLVGVYGVSFILVLLNVLLFRAIKNYRARANARTYVVAWFVVFAVISTYDAFRWFRGMRPPAGYLQVAAIQPNVPQRLKWDAAYSREILKKLFAMQAAALRTNPRLVVWPETAIPFYIDERRPFSLTEMGTLPPNNSYILTGILNVGHSADGLAHFYNSAALFDPPGTMLQRYKKIYLVPGSELFPFRKVIGFTRIFFSIQRITYGAMEGGTEATVFSIPEAKFSVLICYESAFPQLSREFRLRGADFLVNVTNDAWFGRSFGPYQHAAFLVMRAIENRTAVVRSANTGISGFIDPMGRWHQRTALFTEAIISERIPLTHTLTFYTRYGDQIVYLSYAVIVAFAIMALRKKYSLRRNR
jgi:apolipoprotein N-acyltransferase